MSTYKDLEGEKYHSDTEGEDTDNSEDEDFLSSVSSPQTRATTSSLPVVTPPPSSGDTPRGRGPQPGSSQRRRRSRARSRPSQPVSPATPALPAQGPRPSQAQPVVPQPGAPALQAQLSGAGAQAEEGAPRILEGAQGVALPSWEEARTTRVATMRHIPKAARGEWGKTAAETFHAASQSPQEEKPWLLIYILARCVLVARPGEQGTAGGRSAAQRVKNACHRWRNGEASSLWKEATQESKVQRRGRRRKAQAPPTLEESNARRAKMLAQEGQLSRAAQALVSIGMESDSAAALAEMEDKHPHAEPPPEADPPETPPISVSSDEVADAVRGFRPGSAPGPSGLRGEHLKEVGGRGEGRGAAALGSLPGW